MHSGPEKTLKVLTCDETLGYFLNGPDKWNELVEQFDEIHFDFSNVDWNSYKTLLQKLNGRRQLPNELVSFKDYKFKSGVLNFSGAKFELLSLDISDIDLGNTTLRLDDILLYGATINLSNLKIGVGTISLRGSQLGISGCKTDLLASSISIAEGNLICSDVFVYNGDVDFSGLKLSNGNVDFSGSVFGDGAFSLINTNIEGHEFDFMGCSFGKGNKYFSKSAFNVLKIDFSGTNFGEGIVDFVSCNFSKVKNQVHFNNVKTEGYRLNFMGATFSAVEIDFSDSVFDNKNIDFDCLNFANGNFLFESCEFHGRVSFSDYEENASTACQLSFRKSIFNSTLDISGVNTTGIIDLRETKLSTHTTLDNLGFTLARYRSVKFLPGLLQAASNEDASKLRRLKEIAEANKNHTAALRFHAAEMRARRWHDMPVLSSILDGLFSMISNYGQSILRPFIAWLVLVVGCGSIYSGALPRDFSAQSFLNVLSQAKFADGFLYSLVQTLPVFPISRTLQQDLYTSLSVDLSPTMLSSLTIMQNLLGVIFLFLIGLGLRNRFRL